MIRANVNNTPKETRRHIVARAVDGALWYYASYDNEEQAKECAVNIDGVVLEVEE